MEGGTSFTQFLLVFGGYTLAAFAFLAAFFFIGSWIVTVHNRSPKWIAEDNHNKWKF